MAINLSEIDTWTPVVITKGRWAGRVGILDGDATIYGGDEGDVRFTDHVLGPYYELPAEDLTLLPGADVDDVERMIAAMRGRPLTVRLYKRYCSNEVLPLELRELETRGRRARE